MRCALAALATCTVSACARTTKTVIVGDEERTVDCWATLDLSPNRPFVREDCSDRASNAARNERLQRDALAAARSLDCVTALRLAAHLQIVAAGYDHSSLEHDPAIVSCHAAARNRLAPIELPRDPTASAIVKTARSRAADGDCHTANYLAAQVRERDREYYRRVFVTDAAIAACLEATPIRQD